MADTDNESRDSVLGQRDLQQLNIELLLKRLGQLLPVCFFFEKKKQTSILGFRAPNDLKI